MKLLQKIFLGLALIALCPNGVAAAPEATMSFRNNLLPGQLTKHRIVRTTRRTAEKKGVVETLIWKQEGRLIQCNIDESKPGGVMMYQMISDGAAEVLKVFQNDQLVQPTPDAALYNLPQPSTRLHSVNVTARDAAMQAPMADRVNRALMQAMLDFAHWPAKKIAAGHRWERRLTVEGFEGTQRYEFTELAKVDGDVTARVKMSLAGEFTDKLEKDFAFKSAECIVWWSRPDRVLTKLEARAAYERKRDGKPEEFDARLTATLTDLRLLDDDGQEQVKQQLTVFSEALKELREGHTVEALRRCRAFRDTWPRSLWTPAIAQLESQASPSKGSRLSTREVRNLLAQSIVTWEAARSTGETDLVEKTQKAFYELARDYRGKLASLSRDKNETVRASAIFALSFSDNPADTAAVNKALGDKSARVRSMGLAGLAARRAGSVSVEALLKLLDDSEPSVRRRACQAVAACIPPEHYSIVAVVEKTGHMLIHDESDMVRREAVRTMAAIGAAADIETLQRALRHELDKGIRGEIEKAISILEKKE